MTSGPVRCTLLAGNETIMRDNDSRANLSFLFRCAIVSAFVMSCGELGARFVMLHRNYGV